jgi:hypothetical protein
MDPNGHNGMIWLHNSCAFDSIMTTLVYIIKTMARNLQRVIFDSLQGGEILENWMEGRINHVEAKEQYLPYVYNRQSGIVYGRFTSLDRVWNIIIKSSRHAYGTRAAREAVIDVDAPQPREAFELKVKYIRKCNNPACRQFHRERRRTDRQNYLTLSVRQDQTGFEPIDRMYKKYLEQNNESNLRCSCHEPMIRHNEIESMPIILHVVVNVDENSPVYHIDKEFIMEGVSNNDVCVYAIAGVVYASQSHFTSRFVSADYIVYHYDGCVNTGICTRIGHLDQNPFPTKDPIDGHRACCVFYKSADVTGQ